MKQKSNSKPVKDLENLISQVSMPNLTLKIIELSSQLESEQLLKLSKDYSRMWAILSGRMWFILTGSLGFEAKKRDDVEWYKPIAYKPNNEREIIFEKLAKALDIDSYAFHEDYRIFVKFGDYLIELLSSNPDKILPRYYYLTAARFPKPLEILQFFEEQYSKGGYNIFRARYAARLFGEGATKEQVIRHDKESIQNNPDRYKDSTIEAMESPVFRFFIPKTNSNQIWIEEILNKYETFDNWFSAKCNEEFKNE